MSNCFLIIPSFSELLLVFYEPAECTFVHNITVFNNSLGNIANCAQQESRTPVQPSRPGRTAPASHCRGTTGNPASHCRGTTGNPFYRIFMPFSSTVITSTSIALPGISLVSVIFLPSSSRSTVSFFGLSSL